MVMMIELIGAGNLFTIYQRLHTCRWSPKCMCSTQLDQGINQGGEFCPLNILKRQIEMQMGSVKQESVNLNVK